MLHKYFYVITRDGQIFELKYDGALLKAVADTMTSKGLITLKDYGVILNGVDISKVLIDEQYDNYVSNTSPKEFIKEGIWRDGKEKKIIRYAKWKQEQLDYIRQIDKPKEFTETPEQRKKVNDMLEKLYKKSKMIPE